MVNPTVIKNLKNLKSGIATIDNVDEVVSTGKGFLNDDFYSVKTENRGAPKKDIDRNIFSGDEGYPLFSEKMTTPLKSGQTIDEILKKDYTGNVPTIKPKTPYEYVKEEFIGPKKEKLLVARGHVAQTDVRPKPVNPNSIDQDTYDIIKQVSDEDGFITPKSEITGAQSKISSLYDVDDYLKHGKKRIT